MLTIEALNQFGADTAEGLGRCYQNEALYLRLVQMIPAEQSFDKLQQAVDAHDLDAAFEAVHALKGVLGNLSLTPMYEKSCELTELLRARTEADYAALILPLMEMRDELAALCTDQV